MSAASFLGISGAIALYGYDGFLYSIGFLVAWLVALLLIAELLRNSGRYTMADQLAYRMRQTPVRSGSHVDDRRLDLLPARPDGRRRSPRGSAPRGHQPGSEEHRDRPGRRVDDVYVTFGGMKGTTWVQIVKAVMLMAGTVLITFLVLVQFGFNLSDLLAQQLRSRAREKPSSSLDSSTVRIWSASSTSSRLAWPWSSAPLACRISSSASTPRPPLAARKSVLWAIGLIGSFYLMTLVLGFGAAALVPTGDGSQIKTSAATPPRHCWRRRSVGVRARSADRSAGLDLGGSFATILAVVAGLTLTSASSVAHDLYANVFKKGQARRGAS